LQGNEVAVGSTPPALAEENGVSDTETFGLEFLCKTYLAHTTTLATLKSRYGCGYVTCLKYRILEDVRRTLPPDCGVEEADLLSWVEEKESTWRNVRSRAKAANAALNRLEGRKANTNLEGIQILDHFMLRVSLRDSLTPLSLSGIEHEMLGKEESQALLQARENALQLSGLGLQAIAKRVNTWMY
jgi:hypothetical protein